MPVYETVDKTEYTTGADRQELVRLLRGTASGSHDDMAELYGRTRTAVYSLALSYMKNAHDAQDVTQDTFVRVWQCAHQYRDTGSPMGWLLKICRNLSLMRLRSSDRYEALDSAEWDALPDGESGLTIEDRDLLQRALSGLDDSGRRIVMMHAVTGLKHREIASVLDMPLATVLSKYHRALKKLRESMKGDDVL